MDPGNCAATVNVDNLNGVCRCCMSFSVDMNPIFPSAPSKHLDQKITFCSGLEVTENDHKPKQICDKCLVDLLVAFEFKTKCLRTDNTFQQLSKTGIKKEAVEELSDGDDYSGEQSLVKNEIKVEIDKDNNDSSCRVTTVTRSQTNTRLMIKKRGNYKKCAVKKGKSEIARGAVTLLKLFCEECNLKFDTKQEFVKHKKTHKVRTWVCEICGKVYAHQSSHYTHIRSHRAPQFACALCDYRAYHKSDLSKHMRAHTGTKTYQCEFCTAAYCTSSNLRSHIRRVHERVRRHQCPLCPKQYFESTKLRRHIDSHNDIKRYTCNVCNSQFTRRCYWKKHLFKQHSIEIPSTRPGRKVNLVIDDVTQAADTVNT